MDTIFKCFYTMKRFCLFSCFLIIYIMIILMSSCKKIENKERMSKIEAILCKPNNYWIYYVLDDSINKKYIRYTNCWKFLPDHTTEIGWWDPEHGLQPGIIYGGCGTLMEGEDSEEIAAIDDIKWKFVEKFNVIDFDGGVWKFTRIDHDTIYMKDRYGTRALLINWGEKFKKVKNEIPFNEKDTITLQDPFNDKALSQ